MLRKATILAIALLAAPRAAEAQVRPSESSSIIEEILINAFESDNDNDQANALINSEYMLQKHLAPVDINNSSPLQLMSVPMLSEIQVEKILEYKKTYGSFGSLGELKSIIGDNEATLKWISSFLTAEKPCEHKSQSIGELLRSGRHTLVSTLKATLQQQRGYAEDSAGHAYYDGSPAALCIKYRFNASEKIAWGLTLEKDAGERIAFGDRHYGFDFNSGYIKLEDIGRLGSLIVGDYSASFGHGLILGGGMSMGKYSAGQSMAASGSCIRAYGSCNECSFMRGAAATFRAGKTIITAFGSCNLSDAVCNDASTFRSMKTDGLHRCQPETARKDDLRETHAGIIAARSARAFRIAAAAHYFSYDKTLEPADEIRNANMRPMRSGLEMSVSYQYCRKMASIYGETALDAAKNLATINFIDFTPTSQLKLSLMHRKYSKKYQAMKASSYGQNSRVCNEEGIYAGVQARPSPWLSVSAWADIFRLPWLTYQVSEPTTGHECSITSAIAFSKTSELQIKGKRKVKQTSDSGKVESGYLKAALNCSPAPGLRLCTAAQWSRSKSPSESGHGYLVYQNAQYSISGGLITLAARYALFSAPYSARIYSYENDVSFFFSAPGYYYKGSRYYLVLGTSIVPRTSIQMRISEWNYSDRQQIGSGQQIIDGHRKQELSVYVKYTF